MARNNIASLPATNRICRIVSALHPRPRYSRRRMRIFAKPSFLIDSADNAITGKRRVASRRGQRRIGTAEQFQYHLSSRRLRAREII